nr:MAG TPA: hypothetical protein [Caudoviricetes sp.]DAS32083.1 MAG TPA: hypothetical protein [Caudoviricetes sp.]
MDLSQNLSLNTEMLFWKSQGIKKEKFRQSTP